MNSKQTNQNIFMHEKKNAVDGDTFFTQTFKWKQQGSKNNKN